MKALSTVPPGVRFLMKRLHSGHTLKPSAKRRALPLGGDVPEDYVFERIGKTSCPKR